MASSTFFLPLLLWLLSSLLLHAEAQCNSTNTASTITVSATSTTSTSPATTVDIQVGQNGLTFSPHMITAAQGSVVNFHFYPRNHSVAESRYDSPCQYVDGGIWSGYVPVGSGVASDIFSVTINDSNAHWLYCSQATHCQSGMVMVINPPANSPDTLVEYLNAAQNASQTTDGTVITGGVIVDSSSNSSSSSSSSSTSTAAPSSSSSTTTSSSGSTTLSSSSTTSSSTSGMATSLATMNDPSIWLGVAAGLVFWDVV